MKRILFIDADPAVREALTERLAPYGVEIAVASDADHASRLDPPALIIVAVEEPTKLGFKTFQKLKTSALATTPIVLVTGTLAPELFAKHRELRVHADDYVDTRTDDIVAKIGRLVGLPPADPALAARRTTTPARAQDTIAGGCACGAIRFAITGMLTEVGYCHCRLCQRASGAPVMVFGTVELAAFAWTTGEPLQRRSSSFGERYCCGGCGTQLAMRVDDEPTTIDISIAALDDPAIAPPAFHIWEESRIGWFQLADELPRHARKRR